MFFLPRAGYLHFFLAQSTILNDHWMFVMAVPMAVQAWCSDLSTYCLYNIHFDYSLKSEVFGHICLRFPKRRCCPVTSKVATMPPLPAVWQPPPSLTPIANSHCTHMGVGGSLSQNDWNGSSTYTRGEVFPDFCWCSHQSGSS